MAFGRLRARLDRLEGDAHVTMGDARELIHLAKDVLADLGEEVLDGVEFEFVVDGEGLFDLVRLLKAAFLGIEREEGVVLPISVRLKLREGDSDDS